jgi:hypothetical protein
MSPLGADEGDTRLIELGQGRIADIGNVGRNLLRPELGVARDAGQLLDMDGGEAILLHHTLGDQDRVLEVVAVPGHERDQHVLAQRQFAQVGRGTVGHHVAARNRVSGIDQRPLVDAGVLIGARVLGQVIDVHARLAGQGLVVMHAHDDARGIDRVDGAAAARDHGHAGVDCHRPLHARAHQRGL